jgi:hypothetical protein
MINFQLLVVAMLRAERSEGCCQKVLYLAEEHVLGSLDPSNPYQERDMEGHSDDMPAILPTSEDLESLFEACPPCEACPPLAAISRSSSLGRSAKLVIVNR